MFDRIRQRRLVTNSITPADTFDRDVMVSWLAEHGFVGGDVYQIDFHSENQAMTIYRYKLDRKGGKYVRRGEVATRRPVTVPVRSSPPSWWNANV